MAADTITEDVATTLQFMREEEKLAHDVIAEESRRRHEFAQEAIDEAHRVSELPLGEREDLTHLPIVAIDPADARDHDDAIWAEPDGGGGAGAITRVGAGGAPKRHTRPTEAMSTLPRRRTGSSMR